MNSRLLLSLLSLLGAATASADTAFFTADGKSVIFQPIYRAGILWKLALATGKLEPIPLGPAVKDVTAIAKGPEGETLVLADDAVWLAGEESAKKIADAADAQHFFAGPAKEGPLKDWLFTVRPGDETGRMIFFARKPGAKEFRSTFCRRVEDVGTGTFTSGGRFFFASGGDLWEGGFDASEDDGEGNIATLVGCRIAPLAALNTDMANSGSAWVQEIHAAGNTLFIGMAGRHFGTLLRFPIPAKPAYSSDADGDAPDVPASLKLFRENLPKVQVMEAETGGLTAMAAAVVEGKVLVFHRGEADEEGVGLWLWTDGVKKRIANEPNE